MVACALAAALERGTGVHAQLDLGTDDLFAWRLRLAMERHLCNITAAHREIISHVADLAEAGIDQVTHAEIAAATRYHVRTVGDALRRARALGLLSWRPQYRTAADGVLRRREANVYARTMPPCPATRRPDVRRRNAGTPARARKEARKEAFEWRAGWFLPDLAAIARRREAELGQRWLATRRRDSG
jgi:hypothetical protein